MTATHASDASGAELARHRRRLLSSIVVLLLAYPLLAGLALLTRPGDFVPFGALLGGVLLALAAGGPRFGLIASVVTALLVPAGFAFRLGPFALPPGRIVGFAFLAGWLAALSRRDGPLLRRTPLDAAVAAIVLSFLLSLTANAPFLGGRELSDAMQSSLRVVVDFLAFFIAAASVLGAGRRHLDFVLRSVCLAVSAIAVLGILDWVTRRNVFEFLTPFLPRRLAGYVEGAAPFSTRERRGIRRALGTFGNANELGAVVTMTIPLLIHYGGYRQRRSLYLSGAALCTMAGLLTISRSVVVSLVVVLIVYVVATGRRRLRRSGALVVFAVVAAVAVLSPGLRDTMLVYFQGVTGRAERSVQARLTDYDNVLRQFERTPVAGSGPATWSPQALSRPGNDRVDADEFGQIVLDNQFLSVLAERGAVGILSLLGLLLGGVAIGVRGVRRAATAEDRSLRSALLAALVAYLVLCALFDMWAFYAATKLYFLLLAALVVGSGPTLALVARPAGESNLERAR